MNDYNLNSNEAKIYEVIVLSIRSNEKLTVKKVSEKSLQSQSAIIKLSKKLGYSGFSEMYYELEGSLKDANQVSVEIMNDKNEIKETIEKVIFEIREHRESEMIINSLGFCECAAEYFMNELNEKGFRANNRALKNTDTTKSGIYFNFSERGNNLFMIKQAQYAKKSGYFIVAFTSNKNSVVSNLADINLEINNTRSSLRNYKANLFAARVMMIIECILSNI